MMHGKKAFAVTVTIAIVGMVVIICTLMSENYWGGLAISVLWGFVWSCVGAWIVVKCNNKYDSRQETVFCNCHIQEYIAEKEALLAKNKKLDNVDYIGLAKGYRALGEEQKCIDMLLFLMPNLENDLQCLMFYREMCLAYAQMERLEELRNAYAGLEETARKIKGHFEKKAAPNYCKEPEMVTALLCGSYGEGQKHTYNELKEYFRGLAYGAYLPLTRAFGGYYLGRLLLQSDLLRAKEDAYREFIMARYYGGGSVYAGLSEKMLPQCVYTFDEMKEILFRTLDDAMSAVPRDMAKAEMMFAFLGDPEDVTYRITLYADRCSFQRYMDYEAVEDGKEQEFRTLEELYRARLDEGIVLERDWGRIDWMFTNTCME